MSGSGGGGGGGGGGSFLGEGIDGLSKEDGQKLLEILNTPRYAHIRRTSGIGIPSRQGGTEVDTFYEHSNLFMYMLSKYMRVIPMEGTEPGQRFCTFHQFMLMMMFASWRLQCGQPGASVESLIHDFFTNHLDVRTKNNEDGNGGADPDAVDEKKYGGKGRDKDGSDGASGGGPFASGCTSKQA